MGTTGRSSAKWILYGLLMLALLWLGTETEAATLAELLDGATKSSKECVICDSVHGKCDAKVVKSSCAGYLTKAYGDKKGSVSGSLKEWPNSLTEVAVDAAEGNIGWGLPGFPSRHKNSSSKTKDDIGAKGKGWHRFSSFATTSVQKNPPFKLPGNYQSCYKMRVTVVAKRNKHKGYEIPEQEPRYIRGCSFSKASTKSKEELFNKETGCKIFNYKSSTVELCYCEKAGCNSSTNLKVSQWMTAASILVLLARIF